MRGYSLGLIAALALTACAPGDVDRSVRTDHALAPEGTHITGSSVVTKVPEHYVTTMRSYALSLGIDQPPAVSPVRVVGPEEIEQLVATCLTELGFPATADPHGGVGYESGPRQEQAGAIAEYTCLGRYPLADEFVQPLSQEQKAVYYDWQVDEVLPCLTALGYPAPDVPSREVYLSGDVIWFLEPPGLEGPELAEAMAEVARECEPTPPVHLVYGPAEDQIP